MNIYDLSREFWNFSFENPEKIKPNHIALYFFAIEHCNRLGWKEKFGFPTTMAMEAVSIKSYNTYIKTLGELVDMGFVKMIERSKNQYSANIIALSKFDKAHDKALDKAMIKHSIKQSESTVQSIDSIDKQIHNSTNLPNNFLLKKETKEGEILNSENEPDKFQEIPSKKVALKKVSFRPPDPQEVQNYCDERQNGLNGQEFCDFYESKGWMVGKNKMKNWEAAVRTWEKYRKNENGRTNNKFNPNGKNNSGKVSGTQNLIDGLEYFEFT